MDTKSLSYSGYLWKKFPAVIMVIDLKVGAMTTCQSFYDYNDEYNKISVQQAYSEDFKQNDTANTRRLREMVHCHQRITYWKDRLSKLQHELEAEQTAKLIHHDEFYWDTISEENQCKWATKTILAVFNHSLLPHRIHAWSDDDDDDGPDTERIPTHVYNNKEILLRRIQWSNVHCRRDVDSYLFGDTMTEDNIQPLIHECQVLSTAPIHLRNDKEVVTSFLCSCIGRFALFQHISAVPEPNYLDWIDDIYWKDTEIFVAVISSHAVLCFRQAYFRPFELLEDHHNKIDPCVIRLWAARFDSSCLTKETIRTILSNDLDDNFKDQKAMSLTMLEYYTKTVIEYVLGVAMYPKRGSVVVMVTSEEENPSPTKAVRPSMASVIANFRRDKTLAMQLFTDVTSSLDATTLLCFESSIRDDEDVVLAAVKKNGSTLRYASSRLRQNVDIVRVACHDDSTVKLYSDWDVCFTEWHRHEILSIFGALYGKYKEHSIATSCESVSSFGCSVLLRSIDDESYWSPRSTISSEVGVGCPSDQEATNFVVEAAIGRKLWEFFLPFDLQQDIEIVSYALCAGFVFYWEIPNNLLESKSFWESVVAKNVDALLVVLPNFTAEVMDDDVIEHLLTGKLMKNGIAHDLSLYRPSLLCTSKEVWLTVLRSVNTSNSNEVAETVHLLRTKAPKSFSADRDVAVQAVALDFTLYVSYISDEIKYDECIISQLLCTPHNVFTYILDEEWFDQSKYPNTMMKAIRDFGTTYLQDHIDPVLWSNKNVIETWLNNDGDIPDEMPEEFRHDVDIVLAILERGIDIDEISPDLIHDKAMMTKLVELSPAYFDCPEFDVDLTIAALLADDYHTGISQFITGIPQFMAHLHYADETNLGKLIYISTHIRQQINTYEKFMNLFLCGIKYGNQSDCGGISTKLSSLKLGNETESAIVTTIAAYLGIPPSNKIGNYKFASEILLEWGY